ncbi:MAG: NUDIX hydrolase [Archaeoglobi archaeon]|nr:NUDIX hydrolase [Candidatus Mnemosynella sp.]
MRCPLLAVDGILIEEGRVLLVRRLKEPFKSMWALPGGFVEIGETVEEAIKREMREETGLEVDVERLIGVYSDPKRDPRGHVVSIAFLLRKLGGELSAGDDAERVAFHPLEKLPELAFDHERIIRDALKLLKL